MTCGFHDRDREGLTLLAELGTQNAHFCDSASKLLSVATLERP
jgi:hypothetical protein